MSSRRLGSRAVPAVGTAAPVALVPVALVPVAFVRVALVPVLPVSVAMPQIALIRGIKDARTASTVRRGAGHVGRTSDVVGCPRCQRLQRASRAALVVGADHDDRHVRMPLRDGAQQHQRVHIGKVVAQRDDVGMQAVDLRHHTDAAFGGADHRKIDVTVDDRGQQVAHHGGRVDDQHSDRC